MKIKSHKIISVLLCFVLVFTSFTAVSFGAVSKGKIKVSKVKITLELNKSYQLKPTAARAFLKRVINIGHRSRKLR